MSKYVKIKSLNFSSKNYKNVVQIAKRVKRDVDGELKQKIRFAEVHFTSGKKNRNMECYVVLSDIRRLARRSEALTDFMANLSEPIINEVKNEPNDIFSEHFDLF